MRVLVVKDLSDADLIHTGFWENYKNALAKDHV